MHPPHCAFAATEKPVCWSSEADVMSVSTMSCDFSSRRGKKIVLIWKSGGCRTQRWLCHTRLTLVSTKEITAFSEFAVKWRVASSSCCERVCFGQLCFEFLCETSGRVFGGNAHRGAPEATLQCFQLDRLDDLSLSLIVSVVHLNKAKTTAQISGDFTGAEQPSQNYSDTFVTP